MTNPAPYEDFSALKIRRDGHVLTVEMDNPPLNAMTEEIHAELARIFPRIHADRETRVVVLTGAGEKAFSAGGDLNKIADNIDNQTRWMRMTAEGRDILLGMVECDTPIVARINGHAIGLGASLALAADMAIMKDSAKFGDSHVAVGLVAGDGGALLWPLMVGLNRAKQFLLSGEPMTGTEAAAMGLVNIAVPADALDATVADWAERIARHSPVAVKGTKRALNSLVRQNIQVLAELHLGLETLSHLSADHREAVLALRDKRTPDFKGE